VRRPATQMQRRGAPLSDHLDALRTVSRKVLDEHRPPLPAVVYHYTTTNGLLAIIPKKEIWATDVRYFNDRFELRYALDTIGDVLANKMELDSTNKFTQLIFDAIGPITFIKYGSIMSRFHFYATCFSTEGDDLYQWRTYSASTGGYAIGFQTDELQALDICNVIYDQDEQIEIVKQLISAWKDALKEERVDEQNFSRSIIKRNVIRIITSVIYRLALQFKNRRFAAEQEWRVIANRSDKTVEYRNGRLGLTPYIKLDLCSSGSPRMPIVSLTQGPRLEAELEAEALAGFLKRYGYDEVERRLSEVPIRF
jgi:hypothetical protein